MDWIPLDYVYTFLLPLLFLMIAYNYLWPLIARKNLPPGPFNFPIVGCIPSTLGKRMETFLREMKEKYGDVVYMQLGATKLVLLCSYETITEALQYHNELAVTRPEVFSILNYILDYKGILIENGKIWQEHRKFFNRTLKDLGLGRENLETQIREEAAALAGEIRKSVGKAVDFKQTFVCTSANVISALIDGFRYKYGDPEFVELLSTFNTIPYTASPFHIVNIFPYFRFILPAFASGMAKVEQVKKTLYQFVDRKIAEHKASTDENCQNYTSIYLRQEQEDLNKGLTNSSFTCDRLRSSALIINVAGMSTTASTLYWAVKMVITHPKIQDELHNEIDRIIGSERIPSFSDKSNMPYTEAFIMEVFRFSAVVPVGGPRTTQGGTKLAGYDIPPGAILLPLLFMIHTDKKLWGDPENFRPERFIGDDGKLIKTEHLKPFSMGRRSCPGENLAWMEIFIFLTSILQKFVFRPASEEDTELHVDEIGFTRDVSQYKVDVQIKL